MKHTTVYKGTRNLGDIIQTIAISRLLGQTQGVYRSRLSMPITDTFVVNGWYKVRHEMPEKLPAKTVFAGIHTSKFRGMTQWLYSASVVGARDPWTVQHLGSIPTRLVGCATLTFDRYVGPRSGVYAVDSPRDVGEQLSHRIPRSMPYADQWAMGMGMLTKYRTALRVYTTRLHVILPCLAFGTPVVIRPTPEKGRFSILDAMGVNKPNELVQLKSDKMKETYIQFLEEQLQEKIMPGDPVMPLEPFQ